MASRRGSSKAGRMRHLVSYWILPIVAGIVWLATVLGLLLYWTVGVGQPKYDTMANRQQVAYISDVAAAELKPLFVAGCFVTSLFLDLSFAADRWLRHRGRLVPNTTIGEKVLSGLTILFAIVGTLGLVLLSIFDVARHKFLHDVFLFMFMAGFILSAVFICWEYQRLGIKNREHRVLRVSFWIKLCFVLLALFLAIAFVSCTWTAHYNAGAVMEWVIGIIFTLYVVSFSVDLYPAIYTKRGGRARPPSHGQMRETDGMATSASGGGGYFAALDSQRTLSELQRSATPKPARTPLDL